jgi:hypothetical protein
MGDRGDDFPARHYSIRSIHADSNAIRVLTLLGAVLVLARQPRRPMRDHSKPDRLRLASWRNHTARHNKAVHPGEAFPTDAGIGHELRGGIDYSSDRRSRGLWIGPVDRDAGQPALRFIRLHRAARFWSG